MIGRISGILGMILVEIRGEIPGETSHSWRNDLKKINIPKTTAKCFLKYFSKEKNVI